MTSETRYGLGYGEDFDAETIGRPGPDETRPRRHISASHPSRSLYLTLLSIISWSIYISAPNV